MDRLVIFHLPARWDHQLVEDHLLEILAEVMEVVEVVNAVAHVQVVFE